VAHIRKLLAAIIVAVTGGITAAVTDSVVTNPEKVQIAALALGAAIAYITANALAGLWLYAKGIAVAAVGGLNLVAGYYANAEHLTGAQWLLVAFAVAQALLVVGLPNDPAPPSPEAEPFPR
jgi:hypothetical protein